MPNSKGEKIDELSFTVTTKGNSGCSACGAIETKQCRCRGASGGGSSDAEANSQDLESKEGISSPTLSIKLEYQTGLTPQLERDSLLSAQTIFAQFKKELKDQKLDVREYTAAIIDNELLVKIDDPNHRNAFIQRLNNNPLVTQNKSAHNEKDGAKTNSFSIPNPYALPKCTLS
jgi:hypothetical protein